MSEAIPGETAGRSPSASLALAGAALAVGLGGPILLAYILGIGPGKALALVGSTLLVEYGAVVAGIPLGLPAGYSLASVTLTAAGLVIAQFFLFDALAATSGLVARFLNRTRERGSASVIHRWGIAGLVPGVMIVGFYVCPAISWIFGWPRGTAFLLIISGYVAAALLSWLLAAGLLALVLP